MKIYLMSLGAGLLVGVIYGLLGVRSPAPPLIALLGLLGILLGEQAVPIFKRLMASEPVSAVWIKQEAMPHVCGKLPVGNSSTLAGGSPQNPPLPRAAGDD